MKDIQRIEKVATAREAVAASGRSVVRGPRGNAVDAALRRYLASEAYREEEASRAQARDVEDDGSSEDDGTS